MTFLPYIGLCHLHWNHHIALQWRHIERDGVSNHHPHNCLLNRLSKKTSKLCVTGGELTGDQWILAQRASNAKNVSTWWRHHVIGPGLASNREWYGKKTYSKTQDTSHPFYWHGLTLIPSFINNHIPSKVWEGISNFTPQNTLDVITYPCRD